MTDGSTGDASSPESAQPSSPPAPLSPRHLVLGVIVTVIVIVAVVSAVHYHAGRARRQYDALMLETLDRLLTAQEGFFYDSSHYVGSLRALPTVHVPPGVNVQLVSPDRRSWWGVATHDALKAHRCIVWVGTAPASFPAVARAPDNEARPMCFDDVPTADSSNTRS